MAKSCTKKCIQQESERGREFAQRIASLERGKTAATLLGCSLDTVKKIKSGDYKPGRILLQRWRTNLGAAYRDFVDGKHNDAKRAALELQLENIQKQLAKRRGE